jgi:hypothetical protein
MTADDRFERKFKPGDFLTATATDMAACLEEVRHNDAAAVRVLNHDGREWLREAAEGLAFRAARSSVGSGEKTVTQDFEICPQPPSDSAWYTGATLMTDLVNAGLRRMASPPCPDVTFNEAVVQRYAPCACGISAHRDHVRYINLVGILVIEGEGDFFVCGDRQGHDARRIPAPPGSFLLMRAPGFDVSRYRPFHMLGEVRRERLIVGYRQDTKPGDPD